MKIKCLAISCSPRRDGNTSFFTKKVLDECEKSECETELLYITDYNYSPCRACMACSKTGKCIINDDASTIYNKILEADRLILAAPVFSMGICAQAKMFIDRAQQFWAQKYELEQNVVSPERRQLRKGIFISCAGTNLGGVFDGPIRVVKYFFKMLDVQLQASLCYSGIDKKGDILKNEEALEEAVQYGRLLSSNK